MNLNKSIYSLAAALLLGGLTACNNDFSEPPIPVPEGGMESIGTGAWNKPLSAYQARMGYSSTEFPTPWVTGYIVGYCDVDISNVLSADCAKLGEDALNATVNTNILIATDPDITDWEKVATVQLPSGAARSALNLRDNPDALYKQVCIKGTTGSKYCGAYGVRSVSEYNWGAEGIQEVPDEPVEALGDFTENFESSDKIAAYTAQGWKNESVLGGLSGWYIRTFNNNNYITVSAYLGSDTGGPYEIWLITPPIDIAKLTAKSFTFQTQAAYQADNSTLECFVMTSDDIAASTNTKVDAAIAAAPVSGYSSWVNSGTIDLSGFSGVVYIGWRYFSEKGGSNGSTTYCIDNLVVGGAQ